MTVQTQSQTTRDLRLAARKGLLPVRGGGWLAGFGNLLNKELGEMFRTHRWLWQTLIWVTILDGIAALMLFILPAFFPLMPELKTLVNGVFLGQPPEVGSVMFHFSILVMAGAIGAIILAQDEIIQEKQSGTAAWILSKPAARKVFILTKLLSNLLSVVVFIFAIPGLVLVGEVYLATHKLVPMMPFLVGLGVVLIELYFYLSLTIMLGVLYESRGPLMGITFGILFGGMMLKNLIPYIAYVLPLAMEGIAIYAMQGMPLPPILVSELISTVVLSVIFTLVALWRFHKIEL